LGVGVGRPPHGVYYYNADAAICDIDDCTPACRALVWLATDNPSNISTDLPRTPMEEQIVDTWRIHNRINLYLLDAIAPEALDDSAVAKGRTVGEALAHLHNVRLMWLKAAAPDLLDGVEKIEKEDAHQKERLTEGLERSGEAIAMLLESSVKAGGKVKGFKPHATAFLGYMIAHESHHRGQIALRLKQSGHALDKKISYGMWEWGSR
jgi:uncharacterized damage-inducible protein DinB